MIASVRGTLLELVDGAVVVEAGGLGYLVQVSTHTLASLPPVGQEVTLRTRHIVREDAQLLFGFADAQELRLFDLLIGVSGVGPKLALAALSCSGSASSGSSRAVARAGFDVRSPTDATVELQATCQGCQGTPTFRWTTAIAPEPSSASRR